MVNDTKRTEPIKAWFTERELLDLSRISARDDRKVGEMVRVMVRRALYGTMGADTEDFHGANSPEARKDE